MSIEKQELRHQLGNVIFQLNILELMLSDMSNVTMYDIEEWLKETRKCVE